MEQKRNVAILIFDEVEVLDFCGPFEVFGVTGYQNGTEPFDVYTVAEEMRPVIARNGLSINPAHTIADCPRPDVLVVPGGLGARKEMDNPILREWIEERAKETELTLSVCTGALMLAKAGLLEGLSATTHRNGMELLKELAPATTIEEERRFVDNGRIILSAGISAGIDASLHAVAKLLGTEQALETARYMEYEWEPVP
jgi:transcriptional regulator GlxA family with amidase domain